MTTAQRSQVKNAPLVFDEDRSDFVEWATSVPDGSISAGWQSLHPHFQGKYDDAIASEITALEEGQTPDVGILRGRLKLTKIETSRRSLGKFVELSRRRLGQSLEQLAESAGVDLAELLAIEMGEDVAQPETVQRLANFLGVNPKRLLQLAGLVPTENCELEQAALHFAARTESVKPLEPGEQEALERFFAEAFAEGTTNARMA